ncbi:MAG: 50S ribosomal protein L37ae [Candidatus Bathyarchaeia archaeon]|nr:50S ribosomal protein L37ae [Candidatus Bathyarchaeota archaeon]
MGKARKIGLAATFGARYGTSPRKRYLEVMREMKSRHGCPNCLSKSVKRVSVGIWRCRKCGYTFTGGAYTPHTKLGAAASRASSRASTQKST